MRFIKIQKSIIASSFHKTGIKIRKLLCSWPVLLLVMAVLTVIFVPFANVLADSEIVDVTFAEPQYYSTDGELFTEVKTGDFNKDGNMDFAGVCYRTNQPDGTNKLVIYFGMGDGTFDPAQTYIVGTSPFGLQIADLNKDGYVDLVVACNGTDYIEIFLNNGDGSFTCPTNVFARKSPYFTAIADFDGDGNFDIAAANNTSAYISILKGDGHGNFTLLSNKYSTGGNNVQSIRTADLNYDGCLDIVAVNCYTPGISILFGNGNGTFQEPVMYPTHDHPYDARIGDLNHDNVLDIVVTNENSQDLSVLIGNGDGTFKSAVNYSTKSGGIVLADLNCDGNIDVEIAVVYGNYASILLGKGDGVFLDAITIPTVHYWGRGIDSADFNGDGVPDLVLGQQNNICVLINTTSSSVPSPTPAATPTPTPIPNTNVGNTAGNIINGGMAAQSGNWIYYQNTSDNRYLYKLNTQTNAETQLNSDNTMYINVIDDLIVYSNYSDNQRIYRISTDGAGRTKICDDKADTVTLVADWIYYRNLSDSGSLYKIKTDGTSRTKLNSQNSYCINVVGDKIYYSHDGGGFYIKSISTNGANLKTLNNDYSYDLNVVGGWIYYTNYKYGSTFYKIRTDGTDRSQVDTVAGFNKNISDEWLYFVNWDDGKCLYKMKLDGSQKTKMTNEESSSPIVLDEWVYYYNGYTGDSRDLLRIRKEEDDLLTCSGSIHYSSPYSDKNTRADSQTEYYYSDNYFLSASENYSPNLATMSLCLALTSWSSNEDISWPEKTKNARALLTDDQNGIGFTDFEQNGDWDKSPTTQSIGVIAARKQLNDFTLIALSVRGGGYYNEWGGDFEISSSGQHSNFELAKDKVLKFLNDYIGDHHITGRIKLWIVGYSRGAAVANMTAGDLNNNYPLANNTTLAHSDLFCYTFETPQGALLSQVANGDHSNIHNIVNVNDPIPYVSMSEWQFARFGDDIYLPNVSSDDYRSLKAAMQTQYALVLDGVEVGSTKQDTTDYNIPDYTRLLRTVPDLTKILPGGDPFITIETVNSEYGYNATMLATFFDELARIGFQSRSNYYNKVEETLVTFIEDLKAYSSSENFMEFLSDLKVNLFANNFEGLRYILSPMYKLSLQSTDKRLAESQERLLEIIMKSAGYSNLSQALGETILSLDRMRVYDPLTFIQFFDNLFVNGNNLQAHYPEVTLAWLRALDDNYTKNPADNLMPNIIRVIRINCPVDVKVYDENHVLVASIINGAVYAADGSYSCCVNENGEKQIQLPGDGDYTIEILATGNGSLSYMVGEYQLLAGKYTYLQNYSDISIQIGNQLLGLVPAISEEEYNDLEQDGTQTTYQLQWNNGSVIGISSISSGDDVQYYTVAVQANNDCGLVTGSGVFLDGSFAQVEALPIAGGQFQGWYIGGTLVSNDATYRFPVSADVQITAKFLLVEQYTLTFTSAAGGTVENEDGVYSAGTTVLLSAVPAGGYKFSTWECADSVISDITNPQASLLMPAQNINVKAVFKPILGDANNDGTIDIMDLVVIIDYIVNGTNPASTAGADANSDGTIDIMDLVFIIDLIVNPPVNSGMQVKASLQGEAGAVVEVEVPFSSTSLITALEVSYTLSPGLSFVSAECPGMTGKGGSTNAVFTSLTGVTSGIVTLRVKLNVGVTTEQFVNVTAVTGANTAGTRSVGIAQVYPVSADAPTSLIILQQPVNTSVIVGSQGSFKVVAAGVEPLTYQWYIDRNDGIGWVLPANGTQNQYVSSSVMLNNDGYRYYCCVTDANRASVNSEAVTLTVVAAPQTGDSSHIGWIIVLMLLSATGIYIAIFRKQRQENEKQ